MAFVRKLKTATGVYLVRVETARKNGKVVQRHVGMVGKIIDGKETLYGQISSSKVADVSIAGDVLVLKEIMNQLGILDILDKYTDGKGKWIAALVLAHCTSPGSLSRMSRWCQRYGASDLLDISQEECRKDRFYRALDTLDEQTIQGIGNAVFQRIKTLPAKDDDSIFYDVTNAYFYGTKCGIAKSGYNSEDIDLPQIHIGLAVTKPHGFPLFHQVYEGNIQDVRGIQNALKTFKDLGIKQTTLVLDRGFVSESTLADSKRMDLDVIMGLRSQGRLKQKAIESRKGIDVIGNRVRLSTQIIYAKGFQFAAYGHKGKLVVCSNEKERVLLKELRHDEIEKAIQKLKKGQKIREQVKKYINGNKIDMRAVAQAELTDGLYTLFSTNASLTAQEIVKTYFDKDKVEKAFRCLKGMIKLQPVRHWLSDRVRAHVFVCYLSYALFSVLDWKLSASGIDISFGKALDLLGNIYRVTMYDPSTGNKFVKHSTMSKQQEKLFTAVNKQLLGYVV